MDKRNGTGLKEEHQDHTPVQGTAATVEPVNRKEPRMVVADILPEGKENAMSAEALCSRLGLETVRELQKEIARERAAGAVILPPVRRTEGISCLGTSGRLRSS